MPLKFFALLLCCLSVILHMVGFIQDRRRRVELREGPLAGARDLLSLLGFLGGLAYFITRLGHPYVAFLICAFGGTLAWAFLVQRYRKVSKGLAEVEP